MSNFLAEESEYFIILSQNRLHVKFEGFCVYFNVYHLMLFATKSILKLLVLYLLQDIN